MIMKRINRIVFLFVLLTGMCLGMNNASAKEKASAKEGYIDIKVNKKWEGKKQEKCTVYLLKNGKKTSTKVELSKNNNWSDTFKDLPQYDNTGKEIEYTVEEEHLDHYKAAYKTVKKETKKYWVMMNGPQEIKPNKEYVIMAQDWGQALYFNNPNTYYMLKSSNEGQEVGLKRIEKTNLLFKGPKSKNGGEALVFGGKSYPEYLNPDNEYTKAINNNLIWMTKKDDKKGKWTLQNKDNSLYMTLRGDNAWYRNYAFISSDKDGWKPEENKNYSRNLSITDGNDGMVRISGQQQWGGFNGLYWDALQYSYLDLTAHYQKMSAINQFNAAAHYKFFAPITKTTKEITITNSECIDIKGTKIWDDENDKDKKRPDNITVHLFANGNKIKSIKVSQKDNWKYTFNDLDKYRNGKEIKYTIQEEKVADYETKISGYNITNTHKPRKPKIPEPSKKETPKKPETGDGNSLAGYMAIMTGTLLASLILLKKKKFN